MDDTLICTALESTDRLVRAVVISLFTWRRANADDDLPGTQKMGWWGDSFASIANDKIGSRLWLLSRSSITTDTVARAQEYAEEALQWLIDDEVAARLVVTAERYNIDTIAIAVALYESDGKTLIDKRFTDVWEFLNV